MQLSLHFIQHPVFSKTLTVTIRIIVLLIEFMNDVDKLLNHSTFLFQKLQVNNPRLYDMSQKFLFLQHEDLWKP